MTARLPTDLLIDAQIRRAFAKGRAATVINKGHGSSGSILLKIFIDRQSCRVLTQTTDFDGNLAWLAAFDGEKVSESEADAYIARQLDRDPDLWAVEFEDPSGENPFEGKEL